MVRWVRGPLGLISESPKRMHSLSIRQSIITSIPRTIVGRSGYGERWPTARPQQGKLSKGRSVGADGFSDHQVGWLHVGVDGPSAPSESDVLVSQHDGFTQG